MRDAAAFSRQAGLPAFLFLPLLSAFVPLTLTPSQPDASRLPPSPHFLPDCSSPVPVTTSAGLFCPRLVTTISFSFRAHDFTGSFHHRPIGTFPCFWAAAARSCAPAAAARGPDKPRVCDVRSTQRVDVIRVRRHVRPETSVTSYPAGAVRRSLSIPAAGGGSSASYGTRSPLRRGGHLRFARSATPERRRRAPSVLEPITQYAPP